MVCSVPAFYGWLSTSQCCFDGPRGDLTWQGPDVLDHDTSLIRVRLLRLNMPILLSLRLSRTVTSTCCLVLQFALDGWQSTAFVVGVH
jgi:hypothetical protein